MNKTNESPAQTENVQPVVAVLLRWGQIYGVYAKVEDAQQVQRTMIAKGQIADISLQLVKTKIG